MQMSGLKITNEVRDRVVCTSVPHCGFDVIEREHNAMLQGGPRKDIALLHSCIYHQPGSGTGQHQVRRQGPNEATATACTTSAHSMETLIASSSVTMRTR